MLNCSLFLILFLLTGISPPNQSILQTNRNFYRPVDSTYANDIEIEGIIIDATHTKIGKDFYDFFYRQWNQLEELPKQSITISEQALPQLGSRISVQVEDYLIFQQYIQPRSDIIERMAGYALQQAFLFVQNYDEMQQQLIGEDLKGTGIY
ncbi:MAG: CsgE family curli-type amyloid fiber assembly protein [Ignavibacteria bacterium]|jgi:curli production assembly/transport component CsgE